MDAPIFAYLQKKDNNENYLVKLQVRERAGELNILNHFIAKFLHGTPEEGGYFPEGSPIEEIERLIKKHFHLDELLYIYSKDSERTVGFIGMVKLFPPGTEWDYYKNYNYHNLAKRDSGLYVDKLLEGGGTEKYIILNDAGLNTYAWGNIEVYFAYKNCIGLIYDVRSSFYSNTTDFIATITIKSTDANGNLKPITIKQNMPGVVEKRKNLYQTSSGWNSLGHSLVPTMHVESEIINGEGSLKFNYDDHTFMVDEELWQTSAVYYDKLPTTVQEDGNGKEMYIFAPKSVWDSNIDNIKQWNNPSNPPPPLDPDSPPIQPLGLDEDYKIDVYTNECLDRFWTLEDRLKMQSNPNEQGLSDTPNIQYPESITTLTNAVQPGWLCIKTNDKNNPDKQITRYYRVKKIGSDNPRSYITEWTIPNILDADDGYGPPPETFQHLRVTIKSDNNLTLDPNRGPGWYVGTATVLLNIYAMDLNTIIKYGIIVGPHFLRNDHDYGDISFEYPEEYDESIYETTGKTVHINDSYTITQTDIDNQKINDAGQSYTFIEKEYKIKCAINYTACSVGGIKIDNLTATRKINSESEEESWDGRKCIWIDKDSIALPEPKDNVNNN